MSLLGTSRNAQKMLSRTAYVIIKLGLANPWKWTHIDDPDCRVRLLEKHFIYAK